MDKSPVAQRVTSIRLYVGVTAALFALLGLTVGAAYLDLGPLNTPIAMLISLAKGILIVLVFMQVRRESPLIRLFACAGFFWLALLLLLAMSDYLTRS